MAKKRTAERLNDLVPLPLGPKSFCFILLVLSFAIHFVGLSHPRSVIFDEVHFGKFVSAYCCNHDRIFDIHPPHAKLLIAGAAKLGGYRGDFGFDHIAEQYKDASTPFFLRLVPAISGFLLPLAIYILLLQLGVSAHVALLGGMLIIFDNAFTVQTRIIALDGVLLLSTVCTLVFAIFSARSVHYRSRFFGMLTAGGFAGLAVGTKFTGLVAPFLLGILFLWKFFSTSGGRRKFLWLRLAIPTAFSFFLVYLGGWVFHFVLLTKPGYADGFYQLTNNFWVDLVELHRVMLSANNGLTASHPDASPAWSWPLMKRPPFYWSAENSRIYFLGNPVVWWGVSSFFLFSLAHLVFQFISGAKELRRLQPLWWLPLLGYFVAFLPYLGVSRILFMYHYLPPLIFSLLFVLVWAEQQQWISSAPRTVRSWSYLGILALVLLGFGLVSPFTFGFHPWLPQERIVSSTLIP